MSEWFNLTVIDHNKQRHNVPFLEGDILLDVLDDNELYVRTECGGLCACTTCHVYIDGMDSITQQQYIDKLNDYHPADYEEQIMLDQLPDDDRTPVSRLGCSVVLNRQMEGAIIALAPGSEPLEE